MPTQAPPARLPARFSADVLERNLQALDEVDPEMARRLRLPVDGERVRFDESGKATYRVHRDRMPLDLDPAVLEEDLAEITGADRVAALGLGLGEGLDVLLREPGPRRILAWERDPWLLRLCLLRRDCRNALRSGRLRLALCGDLLGVDLSGWARLSHPFLAGLYRRELACADRGLGEKRIALCAGGLFVEQLGRALEARGFDVWTLEAEALAAEELSRTMRQLRPRIVASINYTEGLAEFCRRHDAKLMCWEVDPSLRAPLPHDEPPDHAFVFTHRRANVAEYRAAGFEHVEYMPLAADPAVRAGDGTPFEDREHPLSFVGASMVSTARRFRDEFVDAWTRWKEGDSGAADEGRLLLSRIVATQREHPTRFLLRDLLEAHAPGFARAAIDELGLADPALLAGEIAASEKRLGYLANLGKLDLRVWGDPGWRVIEPNGVRYMGNAGHQRELTQVYNHSRINVDVGRVYQNDIVTMRVYDVLSCGAFVLAEHNAALEEVFDVGVELESYRTVEELRAKAIYYLDHPAEARAIAERGREAVHRRHTIAGRLEHMLETMGEPLS